MKSLEISDSGEVRFVVTDLWEGKHERTEWLVGNRAGEPIKLHGANIAFYQEAARLSPGIGRFADGTYYLLRGDGYSKWEFWPIGTASPEYSECRKATNPRNRRCPGCENDQANV